MRIYCQRTIEVLQSTTTMTSYASTEKTKSLGHVVVTGGSGFLGHHIVDLLTSRGSCSHITSLDIRPDSNPVANVGFEKADITDYATLLPLFERLRPDAVIHTASPHAMMYNKELFDKVNVEGTKCLVRCAQETSVKAFVYTSSASVIHDTVSDLVNADESYPLIIGKDQPEYYTTTKVLAELHVLRANRSPEYPKFLTAAIRPSGMFGEGDVQLIPPLLSAYYRGQTKVQLGNNENLFDFTEITNVAHAHHLALAALLATHDRATSGLAQPLDHEKVDGEAFFITNDTPVYFFDFARLVWSSAGDTTQPRQVWTLPKDFGLLIATLLEWVFWILRWGQPNLTRQKVKYTCMTRYFCIDKAKKRLGYAPVMGLKEGIRRGMKDALFRGVVVGQPMELKGKKEGKKEQ